MISELALLNPELVVTTTADLGVDPQDVEGLAFAWLAYRFDRRESGNLPSATGASGSRILGCLYPCINEKTSLRRSLTILSCLNA